MTVASVIATAAVFFIAGHEVAQLQAAAHPPESIEDLISKALGLGPDTHVESVFKADLQTSVAGQAVDLSYGEYKIDNGNPAQSFVFNKDGVATFFVQKMENGTPVMGANGQPVYEQLRVDLDDYKYGEKIPGVDLRTSSQAERAVAAMRGEKVPELPPVATPEAAKAAAPATAAAPAAPVAPAAASTGEPSRPESGGTEAAAPAPAPQP